MKPRGFRNNNPLNIRHGISRWEGQTLHRYDSEFVTFRTMAMGYRAAWKLMENYRFRLLEAGKAYTLFNIIHRWAPPEDGNNTESYIRAVLGMVGDLGGHEGLFPPSTVRGAEPMARILAAMTSVENGVAYKNVPRQELLDGFRLAFPEANVPHVNW